jgi:hypothetical protein
MNFGNLSHRFVSLILAVGIAGGILGLGAQAASAQGITATTPFSFSVDNQQYPPGKYQFTLASLWLLSIRDVDGGGEKFFPLQPIDNGYLGSHGGLTFRNSNGRKHLQEVYMPGTDMVFALLPSR